MFRKCLIKLLKPSSNANTIYTKIAMNKSVRLVNLKYVYTLYSLSKCNPINK